MQEGKVFAMAAEESLRIKRQLDDRASTNRTVNARRARGGVLIDGQVSVVYTSGSGHAPVGLETAHATTPSNWCSFPKPLEQHTRPWLLA